MTVIFGKDIFESCFDIYKFKEKKKIFDVLYNSSISITFSKNYIELLEVSDLNVEAFQALIVELQDNGRLRIENGNNKFDFNEEFIAIAKNSKEPFLFSITYTDTHNIKAVLPRLITVANSIKNSRNWLALEILSQNSCNVCYQDFQNDKEIELFFNEIFSLPTFIKEVEIFDREPQTYFFRKIKGSKIKYYTLLRGGKNFEHERRILKSELQTSLGGRLRLFYTNDRRKLHERKLLIENLMVTIDNSLNNLTIKEPTWEIMLCYDVAKANKWREKCKDFFEVF